MSHKENEIMKKNRFMFKASIIIAAVSAVILSLSALPLAYPGLIWLNAATGTSMFFIALRLSRARKSTQAVLGFLLVGVLAITPMIYPPATMVINVLLTAAFSLITLMGFIAGVWIITKKKPQKTCTDESSVIEKEKIKSRNQMSPLLRKGTGLEVDEEETVAADEQNKSTSDPRKESQAPQQAVSDFDVEEHATKRFM